MLLENLNSNIQKNETKSLSLILYKIQLQMHQGPKHKTWYPKNVGGKMREHTLIYGHR